MPRRAMVLGGGGTVGIAWETGLAAGLLQGGIDLRSADLFIGTSAGSVVGAQLASGYDPRLVLELQKSVAANSPVQTRTQFDVETYNQVFAKWTSASESTQAVRAELGALALKARTMPEEAYVGVIAQAAGVQAWPERRLMVTAVAAQTGDFAVWEKDGPAPIERAVASSCCVPGLFPPVTIGDLRYVDGGVRSGTNADLAEGCDAVVIVAPLADRQSPNGRRILAAEIAALRAGGATVELIAPDPESDGSFGPDMMEAARMVPAAMAGFQQGLALVPTLKHIWG